MKNHTTLFVISFLLLHMFCVVGAAERQHALIQTANAINGMYAPSTRAAIRNSFNWQLEAIARTVFVSLMEDKNSAMNQECLVAFAVARIFGFKPKCLKHTEQLISAVGYSDLSQEQRKAYMDKKNILLASSCAELAQLCDRKKLKKALLPSFRFWVWNELAQLPDTFCDVFPDQEMPVNWKAPADLEALIDSQNPAHVYRQIPASIVLDFLIGERMDDSVGLNWRRPVQNSIEHFVLPSNLADQINSREKLERYKRLRENSDLREWLGFTSLLDKRTDPLLSLLQWEESRNGAAVELAARDDAESDYTRQETGGPNSGAVLSYEDEDGNCWVQNTHASLSGKQRALRRVCSTSFLYVARAYWKKLSSIPQGDNHA